MSLQSPLCTFPEVLRKIEGEIPITKEKVYQVPGLKDEDELSVADTIAEYFDNPLTKYIHIIIKAPKHGIDTPKHLEPQGTGPYTQRHSLVWLFDICFILSYLTNVFLIGGIGGTLYMGKPLRGIAYEGVDFLSSDICLRERAIEKLEEKINGVGALLVRAPPMSGKTSLSQLLEQHLLKNPKIRVFRISILWMGFPGESWTFEEKLHRLMEIT